jgi:hypothetical protein
MPSELSPSSLLPCLQDFEAQLPAHPELLGVLYTGSLGRGTFDRFSDLDIKLWIDAAALETGSITPREVMEWLGPVHFRYTRGKGFATGFVGPDWTRVDLELNRRADLKPEPEYAGARVVKDTEGVLERLVAESAPESVTATPE